MHMAAGWQQVSVLMHMAAGEHVYVACVFLGDVLQCN